MATSLEKWQSVTQHPPVVQLFRGLVERAGIRIKDTGEAFTCIHRGDHIDFEPALDPNTVDYIVEIETFQVDRLADQARTGQIDEAEQFRILKTLFTPATAALLRNPMVSSPMVRRLSGSENLIHVWLRSPIPGEPDACHTLIHINRQWLVIPGLYGNPRRTYRLSPADALEYHKQLLNAIKTNTFSAWWKYASWYRQWRKGVSTVP